MARNNSVQVGQLLQPDFYNKERLLDKYQQNWKTDCFLSSPGTSDSESPIKRNTYRPQQAQWDSGEHTSCCRLEDMTKIPQIKRILGPLEFSSRHSILIDVRQRSYRACLCF